MADNRQILRSIRNADGTRYSPGQEAELEKAFTGDQIKTLTERGALAGDFKGAGKTAAAPSSAFPEDYPGYDVLAQVEGMTPAQLAEMSDEDVLAIKGIGQKTLEQIRSYGK